MRIFAAAVATALIAFMVAYFYAATPRNSATSDPRILFLAPFWSGGGYASEATILAIYLEQQIPGSVRVRHHGDLPKGSFKASLQPQKREPLERMMIEEHENDFLAEQPTITVCHSSAHAW